MSVNSPEFYQLIEKKISDLHGVKLYGAVIEPAYSQVKNRAALIFCLESVLDAHRQKFSTNLSPLTGRLALDHLLLQKYQWPISQIRSLNLHDIILSLQEELSLDNIPPEGKSLLDLYYPVRNSKVFTEFLDEEWDSNLYLQIPKQQIW